jgi:hypothetical protein
MVKGKRMTKEQKSYSALKDFFVGADGLGFTKKKIMAKTCEMSDG